MMTRKNAISSFQSAHENDASCSPALSRPSKCNKRAISAWCCLAVMVAVSFSLLIGRAQSFGLGVVTTRTPFRTTVAAVAAARPNSWRLSSSSPSSSMLSLLAGTPHYRHLSSASWFTGLAAAAAADNSESSSTPTTMTAVDEAPAAQLPYDYVVPDDAVVHIKPNAMKRLRELRAQQQLSGDQPLMLRMGVRSGGCSGMSYVMDFTTTDAVTEDDAVDVYDDSKVQCVVDAKSMLYLYGLELDYSDKLIGGGFKFFNPNAEESCGCGSSFGV